ncbi:hypothetical protein [Chroococcidiopsis sp.]|uniref:hypothetical protein n=1 Tax=Chroococcidiopsis sp. TaxID=3088168 RepID=UPI003F3CF91A
MLPEEHQGEPSAAASSSSQIDATDKATEPVVPVFNPEETQPTPKSYVDDLTIVTPEAEQLEEVKGEESKEEVLAAEQGETFEAKLEAEEEEEE